MIVNLINEGANIALVLIVRVNEKGSNIEYNYTITISNTTAAPMVMVNKDLLNSGCCKFNEFSPLYVVASWSCCCRHDLIYGIPSRKHNGNAGIIKLGFLY